MKKTAFRRPLEQGLTLIEMIVVLAIVVIITTVIMLNLPDLRANSSLELVAQEIAVYVRSAQVYTGATKVSQTNRFISYGMYFTVAEGGNGLSRNQFVLFADADGNGVYTLSPDEKEQRYQLPAGYQIADIQKCKVDGSALSPAPTGVNIVYKKPDPEAYFDGCLPGVNQSGCVALYDFVDVTVESTRSHKSRIIRVSNNGHIGVLPANTEHCSSLFPNV